MTGEEVVHRYPGDPLPIVDADGRRRHAGCWRRATGERLLAEATLASVPT
jgi:hypothetical protein